MVSFTAQFQKIFIPKPQRIIGKSIPTGRMALKAKNLSSGILRVALGSVITF